MCLKTYSGGSSDVLGKDDSLGLNDEEVDELVDVPNKGIQSLTGNCVVSSRANLGGQTVVKNDLAEDLSEDGYTKDHPRSLEGPSENIQVAGCENSRDNSTVCDGRCAYCVIDVSSSSL